jgi:hypothetical protein
LPFDVILLASCDNLPLIEYTGTGAPKESYVHIAGSGMVCVLLHSYVVYRASSSQPIYAQEKLSGEEKCRIQADV